jgi:hypothetical protein
MKKFLSLMYVVLLIIGLSPIKTVAATNESNSASVDIQKEEEERAAYWKSLEEFTDTKVQKELFYRLLKAEPIPIEKGQEAYLKLADITKPDGTDMTKKRAYILPNNWKMDKDLTKKDNKDMTFIVKAEESPIAFFTQLYSLDLFTGSAPEGDEVWEQAELKRFMKGQDGKNFILDETVEIGGKTWNVGFEMPIGPQSHLLAGLVFYRLEDHGESYKSVIAGSLIYVPYDDLRYEDETKKAVGQLKTILQRVSEAND